MDGEDANFVAQYQNTFEINFNRTASAWLEDERKPAKMVEEKKEKSLNEGSIQKQVDGISKR